MLKPEQIASVKGRGFLINRGTECFSGRIVCAGTVFTAADLRTISEIAEKFGISEKRVRNLVAGMLDKTGFRSRTELAVRAREAGIVILERQEDDI